MLRQQFEDLFFERLPFIDHIIFMKYSAYPEEFSRFFNMNSSSRAFEDVTGVVGFDYLSTKHEGQAINYDAMLQGYSSRATHVTYGLGFRTTMEALQDDIDAIMRRGAMALGASARYTPELVAADVFNDGFTSTTGSPDGVSLFSNAHPLRGGGTASNILASADLSVTSLQSMVNNFAAQVNDRGQKLMIRPRRLIVPQALSWTAEQLLGSEGLPGTADNDINSLRMAGLGYDVWHYLTEDQAWFMQADVSETELNFWWRMPFSTDHDIDFDTGDGKSKILGRFSVNWSDWRGVFGSSGSA
jgi:hypothetical protein